VFEKKKKNIEIQDIFYINHHIKDRLDIEFTDYLGELTPEQALISFTVSDAYC